MLGDAIRQARVDRGWSQQDLAEKAKVSRKHISSLERGAVKVSVEIVAKIALALHLREIPVASAFALVVRPLDLKKLKRAIESAAIQIEKARGMLANITAREDVQGGKLPAPVTTSRPGEETQDVYADSDLDPRRRS